MRSQQKNWEPWEDDTLMCLLTSGWSLSEVGHLLDRTQLSIKARRQVIGVPRQSPALWTPEEREMAVDMVARGATNEEYMAILGRHKNAVLQYVGSQRPRRREQVSKPINVPDHVWEDRNRRLLAPRSITALMFGDPVR